MLPETERGSTRSHSVENSLWKKLWTCRKTDYTMNECEVLLEVFWEIRECRLVNSILGFLDPEVGVNKFLRSILNLVPISTTHRI
jgi:hypothetical protein